MTTSGGWRRSSFFSLPVLLLAGIYLPPILLPSLFGWTLGVLAVPVAYILTVEGKNHGIALLRNGFILAGSGSILTGRVDLFLFAVTMVPLGSCMYGCGQTQQKAVKSGGYGVATLIVTWGLFWTVYGILSDIQPYQHLVDMLDAGFVQAYELYKTNSEFSFEVQENLTIVITQLRELLPRILPGCLLCSVLITVWMNQIVWNSLLLRWQPKKAPWPPYSYWKLPDQVIWLPIAATILFLSSSGQGKDIGLNLILISGALYFFQGLAVFIYLLGKWKVPAYFRIVLYLILVIQSYGLILITLLGIGDIWIHFRSSIDQHAEE